jgi:hypothetical protein
MTAKARKYRPQVEELEARCLLDGSYWVQIISLPNHTISVSGHPVDTKVDFGNGTLRLTGDVTANIQLDATGSVANYQIGNVPARHETWNADGSFTQTAPTVTAQAFVSFWTNLLYETANLEGGNFATASYTGTLTIDTPTPTFQYVRAYTVARWQDMGVPGEGFMVYQVALSASITWTVDENVAHMAEFNSLRNDANWGGQTLGEIPDVISVTQFDRGNVETTADPTGLPFGLFVWDSWGECWSYNFSPVKPAPDSRKAPGRPTAPGHRHGHRPHGHRRHATHGQAPQAVVVTLVPVAAQGGQPAGSSTTLLGVPG